MSDDYRLIESKFVIYYTKITQEQLQKEKEEIYRVESHDDSFNFLMAQNNIDSSFDSLNKAFVVMMKEIDAKLNYLITLLRDGKEKEKFLNYNKTYTCSVSASEINFINNNSLQVGDFLSISFFLPISSHNEIKATAKITDVFQKNGNSCAKAKFLDINKNNQELIIYYGLLLDRERLKSKQLEL
ncbi:MAG: hypothetical protein ACP5GK_04490 [Desulfurella sp.]|uniref:PilZ domain-containing protein n=1 Tax=Desulfurella multipotens TaxID=79269 RepID=A0A1G6K2U6_9BACT|nr:MULTISPECIES: hypothetical protein [Desulfurella]AHF97963.1 hypothetical protein DESACE_05275 [Desulfurella acetivorans A63]PMP88140.1 MAG: hypothetical protein C0173_07695 [Desulfurella sp.]SDC25267.1 hypothetical protein SAMN05660835_00545 [Desulfurella multipotens]HEX13526.1 hypothetical protein [Desulfurella acetivorans]